MTMGNQNNNNRILLIDALRAYALFGLFIVHMVEYFELFWFKPEWGFIHSFIFGWFGGKAYAIFALLFGVSFFIILDGQSKKGVDFRARFAWRLTVLMGLGLLHGLIYGGDILQVLAVSGLLLIPLWRLPTPIVLLASLFFLLQIPALIAFSMFNLDGADVYTTQKFIGIQKPVLETYATGSFLQVISINAFQGTFFKWTFMLESGRFSNVIGLSILGMVLGRVGFFVQIQKYWKLYILMAAISLIALVLFGNFGSLLFAQWDNANAAFILSSIRSNYLNNCAVLLSISVLVLIFQIAPVGRLLAFMAPCGRMSLTIYLLQSVACIPLFYAFGFGWYESIGQVNALILGFVLWVGLVLFARWWMQRYYYGPMEWLWRAGTYWTMDIRFKKQL